jgi:mRNA deadenylase 3'-5' endonuclease subunit Ccr4
MRNILLKKFREKTEGSPRFTVMSYNTLCQSSIRREHSPWCSDHCLKWAYRKQNLLNEICDADSDIICVQEMDTHFYDKFWKATFLKLGYESVHKPTLTYLILHSFSHNFQRQSWLWNLFPN